MLNFVLSYSSILANIAEVGGEVDGGLCWRRDGGAGVRHLLMFLPIEMHVQRALASGKDIADVASELVRLGLWFPSIGDHLQVFFPGEMCVENGLSGNADRADFAGKRLLLRRRIAFGDLPNLFRVLLPVAMRLENV